MALVTSAWQPCVRWCSAVVISNRYKLDMLADLTVVAEEQLCTPIATVHAWLIQFLGGNIGIQARTQSTVLHGLTRLYL
jgi:hypothetical protein